MKSNGSPRVLRMGDHFDVYRVISSRPGPVKVAAAVPLDSVIEHRDAIPGPADAVDIARDMTGRHHDALIQVVRCRCTFVAEVTEHRVARPVEPKVPTRSCLGGDVIFGTFGDGGVRKASDYEHALALAKERIDHGSPVVQIRQGEFLEIGRLLNRRENWNRELFTGQELAAVEFLRHLPPVHGSDIREIDGL